VTADAETEPRKTQMEERVDGLLVRLSKKRREGIRKSLERPLRIEALRTVYIVGCILLDIVGLPIALVSVLGRIGLYVAFALLVPLAYLEYRAHDAWFVRDWSAASEDRRAD